MLLKVNCPSDYNDNNESGDAFLFILIVILILIFP